ncbi:MAG: chromate transporter [Acidobacteriota bacterium]|nr:chromate transporter [Acidobacteriota bacterium]
MSEKAQGTHYKSALITLLSDAFHYLRNWMAEQFTPQQTRVEWRALARTFFKLGATGFGGGVAVIAQIRRLVVHERQWMTEEEFLDAVSLAQSLPGANAANATAYVGLRLGGLRGAAVSVSSFLLPSFLMMIALTIAHSHLSKFPDAQRIFQGFNAAVVGLIAATVARLGKTAMQQQWHLELGVAAGFVLIFTTTTVVEAVLVAGMVGIFVQFYKTRARQQVRQKFHKVRQASVRTVALEQQARQHAAELIESPDKLADDYKVEATLSAKLDGDAEKKDEEKRPSKAFPKPAASEAEVKPADRPAEQPHAEQPHDEAAPDTATPAIEKKTAGTQLRSLALLALLPVLPLLAWPMLSKFITVWKLVTIFLRVGTVTFGGGFVMIPQIETDIVDVHRWMDHQTFADGMAFGQITPGPVLITATFIGYKVAGPLGAIAATIAAFLPSFIMTMLAGASLNRFRTNFLVQSFLAGVAPAVVGMLAAAGVTLAKSGLSSPLSYGVATMAFLLMLRARLNPVFIIFGCGLLQWAVSRGLIGWLHI